MVLLYLVLCVIGAPIMYLPTRIYLGTKSDWLPVGAVGLATVAGLVLTLTGSAWWWTLIGISIAVAVHFAFMASAPVSSRR